MELNDSQISTSTQLELTPSIYKHKNKKDINKYDKNKNFTAREVELMQHNIDMSKKFINLLQQRIETLEKREENMKESLRLANTCNAIIYGTPKDLSIACVTNATEDGIDKYSRMKEYFMKIKKKLNESGVGIAFFEEIPINQVNENPI